ncbi:KH domain protein [Fusarium sp. NRRL 25303]|nr:KH domain protein [Fusarium sp. NRRL 25303]
MISISCSSSSILHPTYTSLSPHLSLAFTTSLLPFPSLPFPPAFSPSSRSPHIPLFLPSTLLRLRYITSAVEARLPRIILFRSVDDKIRPDISYPRLFVLFQTIRFQLESRLLPPRGPRLDYCKMSAPQDSIPGNGSDILDQMDQLRMDDRLGPDGEPAPKTDEEYAQAQLTLRAIVSSKEAGVIIGKGGKNVADLRDETGVKAGVSKVVQGVHDRVLTITGGCDAISRAYAIVARALLEGAPAMGMGGVVQSNGTHPIKLLISHNQMGTIIGRQGLKIKHIQDASGVRMVAQKEMLPQSTERIVEVQGTPEGIQRAIWEICKCLVDDWQRGTGTVLYNPVVRTQPSGSGNASGGAGFSQGSGRSDYGGSPRVMRTGNGADFSNGSSRPYNRRSDSDAALRGPPTHDENGEEIQTQNISIPADMVGCIIGRAGSKISEIRKTSGARISIAKAPHDETGERMFTIMGTAKANESALFLLYENLEAEKMRRSQLQEPE